MGNRMCSRALVAAVAAGGCAPGGTTTTTQALGFPGCPSEWLDEVPPNPDWGLPATYGDLVQHPMDYSDFDLYAMWFAVSTDGLKTVLPDGVKPADFFGPGVGLAVVSFWNYKDVEWFGAYRESIVSVQVQDDADPGYQPLFIVEIAVNSEAAQWAGNVTGFGKILGNTHCQSVPPKGTKCMSESDDELIMKATIDTNHPSPDSFALAPTMTLTARDHVLVHTPVTYTSGTMSATYAPSSFRFGEHPLAQQLAAAGIGAVPAGVAFWGHDLSSLVGAGIGGAIGYCTPL